jgi:hypothetical protein
MNDKQIVRSSNIELLRIVSMLLIVATHLCNHYIDVPGSVWPFPDGFVFIQSVKSVTYIGVNMYVLISAYFLCTSSFKSKRVLMTWLEVLFYSVLLGIPYIIKGSLSLKGILSVFLPVLMAEYWFATVFIGMLILSPFINLSLKVLTEKRLRYLCIVLLVLFSVIPSFISPISSWLGYGGSCGILWFVVLYYCASYIRLYVHIDYVINYKYRILVLGICLSLVAAFARFSIAFVTAKIWGYAIGAGFFYGNNIIFNVLSTLLIFLFFLTIKIQNTTICAIINTIAKSSFAVYLIHESPWARVYLEGIIPLYYDISSPYLPFQFMAITLVIWGICTVIDYLRQLIFIPISKRANFTKIDQLIRSCFEL